MHQEAMRYIQRDLISMTLFFGHPPLSEKKVSRKLDIQILS